MADLALLREKSPALPESPALLLELTPEGSEHAPSV